VLVRNFGLKIKLLLYRIILLAILLISNQLAIGQIKKGENIFGIQVSGIIPSSVLNTGEQTLKNDSISFTIGSASGFTLGGMLRHNFSKMFTLETGIHYVSRSYGFNFKHDIRRDSTLDINDDTKVNLVSYKIPVQWLIYIRLTDQVYMNALFGVSFDFYPSDVTKTRKNYAYIILRESWINVALVASIGFEYRTKKSGYFYIGGSLLYPFSDIAFFRVSYFPKVNEPGNFVNLDGKIRGTYFTVELRYFFAKTEKVVKPNIY
jgi:hypothetical protein